MSEDVQEPLTQEQIERWSQRAFAKLRKELQPGLEAALHNQDGTARLLAISDEEWQEAVDADAGDENAT